MITAARFRAEASSAAAAAASASRLARCSRPHFIRNTHRRAAIWSLVTSSRSRSTAPAPHPSHVRLHERRRVRLRSSLRLCDLRRLERRLLLQPLRFQAFPLSSKRPPPHSHLKSPKRGQDLGSTARAPPSPGLGFVKVAACVRAASSAAAAAASAARRASAFLFHFLRRAHRRTAICAAMTAARSASYRPLAAARARAP